MCGLIRLKLVRNKKEKIIKMYDEFCVIFTQSAAVRRGGRHCNSGFCYQGVGKILGDR